MTQDAFLARYPEFNTAPDGMVAAALAEATLAVGDVWEDLRDEIIGLEAAHRLAISPFGRDAKMSSGLGKSTYGEQLEKRKRMMACGLMRVV